MSATTFTSSPPSQWSATESLARFGLLGKAVIHLVIGFLVIQIATGSASIDAGSTGAIRWIAQQSWGGPLLYVLAATFGALAVWRGSEVFTGDPVEGDDAIDRAKYGVKAVFYTALAFISFQAAGLDAASGSAGSGGSGGGQSTQSATSTVFDLPAGQFLVVAAGLGVLAIALYMVFEHAIDAGFEERITVADHPVVTTLGRVGYAMRAVAYGSVGGFLLWAGATHDPDKAKGLGESLRGLADNTLGVALLLAVGVGFIAYGLFCVCESALRRDA